MRAKTVLLLLVIAALLSGGCESDEVPPEPSQPVTPSASAPGESQATPPPPDTGVVPASSPDEEPAFGSPIARMAPNERSIHIFDRKGSGDIVATLPIYRSKDVRYFAAGVGQLERTATYPEFPVKLVFSREDGAYLAFVAVTVWPAIPTSHVKGPWVFLDLKDGKCRIDAVKDTDIKSRANIEVTPSQQQTIFFTWP